MGRKRVFWGVGLAVLIGLLGSLAVASGSFAASRVTHESSTFSGVLADAKWFSAEEPPPGSPGVLALMGADAVEVHGFRGAKRCTKPSRSPGFRLHRRGWNSAGGLVRHGILQLPGCCRPVHGHPQDGLRSGGVRRGFGYW